MRLTLVEALLGFDRTVLTHLDGRHIKVARTSITRPGHVDVVRGEGMPQYRDRNQTKGDLYIRWEVDFPTDAQLAADPAIRDALRNALPPARPDLESTQDTVEDTVEPSPAKIEQFGSNRARATRTGPYGRRRMGGLRRNGCQGPGMQCAPQ